MATTTNEHAAIPGRYPLIRGYVAAREDEINRGVCSRPLWPVTIRPGWHEFGLMLHELGRGDLADRASMIDVLGPTAAEIAEGGSTHLSTPKTYHRVALTP